MKKKKTTNKGMHYLGCLKSNEKLLLFLNNLNRFLKNNVSRI